MGDVPAIRLSHLSESQRAAFLIADNRLTETSSWDERMLSEQLKILSELELGFDLEAIGFEVPEIDLLIDGLNTVPETDPDDHLPEIAESAITVPRDLWQLDKHRVLCGRCGALRLCFVGNSEGWVSSTSKLKQNRRVMEMD